MLEWCADAGAAAIPYGGGTSVVGGVEPRIGDAYAGAVTIDLRRARPRARGRSRLAGGADPGRRPRARRSRTSSPSAGSRCATSRSRSSSRPSAAGSPPAPAGHFATLYTHIDDLVESVRAITPAGAWESRRLPGLRRRAEPRPDADRLRGDPRGDHRGLGARAGAPASQALGRGRVRLLRRRGRGGPRAVAVRPQPVQLPAARRGEAELTQAWPPTAGRCSCSASSRRTTRSMRRWPRRSSSPATTEASPAKSAAAEPSVRRATPLGRGATRSSRRRTCATRWSPAGCSPTRSRRRSPGTASRRSTRP